MTPWLQVAVAWVLADVLVVALVFFLVGDIERDQ